MHYIGMLQVQHQYEEQKAEVGKLSEKLVKDVAETEELHDELVALDHKFSSIEQECTGQ